MAIARDLATRTNPGSVILLYGDLGSGKTRFVKGFAGAFGIDPGEVDSPTFTLLQEYSGSGGVMLWHFDFYRLESLQEALEIGAEEYFYGDGISLVEWPERISQILPPDAIKVKMRITGPGSRDIEISDLQEKLVTD